MIFTDTGDSFEDEFAHAAGIKNLSQKSPSERVAEGFKDLETPLPRERPAGASMANQIQHNWESTEMYRRGDNSLAEQPQPFPSDFMKNYKKGIDFNRTLDELFPRKGETPKRVTPGTPVIDRPGQVVAMEPFDPTGVLKDILKHPGEGGSPPVAANENNPSMEFIKSPSVRGPSGKVYNDINHSFAVNKALEEGEFEKIPADLSKLYDSFEYGYTTSKGRFVSREMGGHIADANKQRPAEYQGRPLLSEDLHSSEYQRLRKARGESWDDLRLSEDTATITPMRRAANENSPEWAAANKARLERAERWSKMTPEEVEAENQAFQEHSNKVQDEFLDAIHKANQREIRETLRSRGATPGPGTRDKDPMMHGGNEPSGLKKIRANKNLDLSNVETKAFNKKNSFEKLLVPGEEP